MKTLEEIKQMMADGDTAQADAALKELLAKEPDNLQAKMLYGTCRQFLGDEETFKRIHDELAPMMEGLDKKESKSETVSLWKKYHALWMSLIVGGLVLVGTAWFFGRDILNMFGVSGRATTAYAGPEYYQIQQTDERKDSAHNHLYGPARDEKKWIKFSDEDTATVE